MLPLPQALKDWHLMIAVVLITGTGVLLLMIGTAVPDLRPSPVLDPDEEDLQGTDVCLRLWMLVQLRRRCFNIIYNRSL